MNLLTCSILLVIILGCIITYTEAANQEKMSKREKFVKSLKRFFHRKKKTVVVDDGSDKVKLNYDLKRREIYGFEINPHQVPQRTSGVSSADAIRTQLRIGQRWQEILHQSNEKIECTKEVGEPDSVSRTKIFQYNSGATTQMNDDEIFSKYFVLTDFEIWSCARKRVSTTAHPNQNPVDNQNLFQMIVNKLHLTNEAIEKIFHYDGVDVKIVPALSNEGKKTRTVEIKEVKYVRVRDSMLLKYDGVLTLNKPSATTFIRTSMFKPIEVFEGKETVDGTILYSDNVGPKIILWVGIGGEGDDLSAGSIFKSTVGNFKDIAVCERFTDDPRLFTPDFLPKIRKLHPTGEVTEVVDHAGTDVIPVEEGVFVPMNFSEFNNYFTVTQQELWRCKINVKHQKDSKNIIFMRKVTELLGKKPVKSLRHSGIMNVWKFKLNHKSSNSVKLKEFYYFLPNSGEQVNFYGKLQLSESENPNKKSRPSEIIYNESEKDIGLLPKPIQNKKKWTT